MTLLRVSLFLHTMSKLLTMLPCLVGYVCAADSKMNWFSSPSSIDSILPSENILGTSQGSRIQCTIACVQIPQCLSVGFHGNTCTFYSTINFTSAVTSIVPGATIFFLQLDFAPPYGYMCVPARRWCYKVVNTSLNWVNARDACVNEGATLLTIQSSQEQDIINKELEPWTGWFWIGIHDMTREGKFEDIHGNAVVFTWWETKHGQPNNLYNNQDCVSIHPPKRWFDNPCSLSAKFICEKRFP